MTKSIKTAKPNIYNTKSILGIKNAPIFGVSWDKGIDPTLIRTDDAVGMKINVGLRDQLVRNDFDFAPIFREIKEVSDIYGNTFVRIPKLYIKKTDGVGYKTWQISTEKYEGFYLPWCFWDFNNNCELPYVDIGKYPAQINPIGSWDNPNYLNDWILQSVPGSGLTYAWDLTDFRIMAKNNNKNGLNGYQLFDIHMYDILQVLLYIEIATLNTQSYLPGEYLCISFYGHAVLVESNTNRIIVSNDEANNAVVDCSIYFHNVYIDGVLKVLTDGRRITNILPFDSQNTAIYFDGPPLDITETSDVGTDPQLNGYSLNIKSSLGVYSKFSTDDPRFPFVYRGIETLYGGVGYWWIDGVTVSNRQIWVCKNADEYSTNKLTIPYEKVGYINGSSNGYIKTMGFDPNYPFAEFPTSITATSGQYYCDYYRQNTGTTCPSYGYGWYNDYLSGYSGQWEGLNALFLSSAVSNGAYTRLIKKAL